MRRILITGMSGTGKSTLIGRLSALGYRAVDTDDDWPRWVVAVPDDASDGSAQAEPDWLWREDRIQRLLSTEDAAVLFVSGCRTNQGRFYSQFDDVILLTAPPAVIAERLATRTTNQYGKHPDELARVLREQEIVEPRLRAAATLEVDTTADIDAVVSAVLRFLQLDGRAAPAADRRQSAT